MSALVSLFSFRKVLLPIKPTARRKAGQIDEEISRVIEQAHQRVRGILSAHRESPALTCHLVSQEGSCTGEELRKMLGKTPAE